MDQHVASRDHDPKIGSERSFGFVMAGFFLLIALWPLIGRSAPRLWALFVGLAFVAVALLKPDLLAPLNRLWFRLGLAIGRITNPIIMGLLFFAVFAPLGILFRALGKDLLALRFDRDVASYWSVHAAAEGQRSDMRKQF